MALRKILPLPDEQIVDFEFRLDQAIVKALGEVCDHLADRITTLTAAGDEQGRRELQHLVDAAPAGPAGQPYVSADDLAVIQSAWQEQVDTQLQPLVAEVYHTSATHIAGQLGVETAVPPATSQLAQQYLADAGNRIAAIGDEVWATARDQLATGFAKGESIPQLATRIRGVGALTERQATARARTEIISAANAGSIATARLSGFDMTKLWLATEDLRTRPTHRLADGQRKPLQEPFEVGGSLLDFPGDPGGAPAEVVNCRCTLTYEIPEPEPIPVEEAPPPTETVAAPVIPGVDLGPAQPRFEEQMTVAQAAARGKQLEELNVRAQLASEVHELVYNEASPRALRFRIGAYGRRTGLDVSRLLPLVDTPQDMLAAVDDAAGRLGLERIGTPGDLGVFDPKLHQLIGPPPGVGESVEVIRPGYWASLPSGERVQLFKAKVIPTGQSFATTVVAKDLAKSAVDHAGQIARNLRGTKMAAELARQAEVAPRAMLDLQDVILPEAGSARAEEYLHSRIATASGYYTPIGSSPAVYATAQAVIQDRPQIWLSPHWSGGRMGRTVERNVAAGWYVPMGDATPLQRTLAHEFGHHVTQPLFGEIGINGTADMYGEAARRLLPIVDEALGGTLRVTPGGTDLLTPIWHGFQDNLTFSLSGDLLDTWITFNRNLIKEKVSEYGAKNFGEFLAEIWTEYSTLGEAARPHIRRIGQVLRDLSEELRAGATTAPGGEAVAQAAPALASMRVADLRKMARELGITVPAGARKADVIRLIEARQAPPVAPVVGPPALTPAEFETRARAAVEGRAADDLPPVQASIEARGSDSATWKATGFEGLERNVPGATTAVTRYLRRPAFINDRLRFPEGRPPEAGLVVPTAEQAARDAKTADRYIAALDKLMDQSALPSDAVLWRGARLADMGVGDADGVGFSWVDPGFVSTSAQRGVAEYSFAQSGESALLRILAPQGTRALGFQGLGESEVLLPHGLRFRIVADRGRLERTSFGGQRLQGARLFDVEIVPVESAAPAAEPVQVVVGLQLRPALANANTSTDVANVFKAEATRLTGRPLSINLGPRPSIETAREHAEGILRGLEAFPDARPPGIRVVPRSDIPAQEEFFAATNQGEGIRFSDEITTVSGRAGYLRSIQDGVDSHFFVPNAGNPAGIALHEFGHVVDNRLGRALRTRVDRIVADYAQEQGTSKSVVIGRISGRAKDGTGELIAEALTDVVVNGEAANVLSRKIYDAFASEYRRRGMRVGLLRTMPAEAGIVPAEAAPAAVQVQAAPTVAQLFETRSASAATGKQALAATRVTITDEITAADIRDYGLQGFRDVNTALETNRGALPESTAYFTRRMVASLDSALQPSTQDIVVSRGITRDAATSIFGPGPVRPGFEWDAHAYTSTSVMPEERLREVFTGGEGGVRMRILVPRGTRSMSSNPRLRRGAPGALDPDEVLLDRGLRFRVVADRGVEEGVRFLDVEVIGTAPNPWVVRQAEIDAVKELADHAALVEQYLADGAPLEIIDELLAAYMGDASVAKILAAVRKPGATPATVRNTARRVAGQQGLTPIGRAGTATKFDVDEMRVLGDVIPAAGTKVQVLSPGYAFTRTTGERIVIRKAVVADLTPPRELVVQTAREFLAATEKPTAAQLRKAGISKVGKVSKTQEFDFDPAVYDPVGGADIKAGAKVRIVEPGYAVSYGDELIVLRKPVVEPTVPPFRNRYARPLDELLSGSVSDLRAEVDKALGGDWPGGIRVDVNWVNRTGPGTSRYGIGTPTIFIDAKLRNVAGGEVGNLSGDIYRDLHSGELVAHHDYIKIDERLQGSGFANEFMANLFDWYTRSGITRIETLADIDVGGYTWAAQGFNFAYAPDRLTFGVWAEEKLGLLRHVARGGNLTEDEINFLTETSYQPADWLQGMSSADFLAQAQEMDKLLARIRDGEQVSAYEISQLGRQPGQGGKTSMWLGKLLMLGSSWNGMIAL